MKTHNRILLATLLTFSVNSYSVEITPLLGYRGGGEFIDSVNNKQHTIVPSDIYGLIIGFPYERGKNIEVYYSHQSSELKSVDVSVPSLPTTTDIPLSIDYLHIGGTAPISETRDLKTFVTGGVGFTYLSPDLSGAQSDLRASLSIGVGLKWPVTEKFAIRLETRGLATMFNNNSAIFCNGGCSLSVNGSFFLQGEVFAGASFSF